MACTVFVNGRGVAHQTSGGMSMVFPDVCKTPTGAGPIPIPYPNIGKASDTTKGPATVKTDGSMPMVKGAEYCVTSGDEAGSVGGVMSSTCMGPAEFMTYSFDVKFEGNNVCRLGDSLFHNRKNTMG
jgi:hypothetical protein